MNRRLMMAQNKGFELVYDAASGTLPTEQGWKFGYWKYGQVHNKIGIQAMENNVLNVCVGHVYECCYYYPTDKLTAKNCEFSVTVDNTSGLDVGSRMGFLLTDGEKAIELMFRPSSGYLLLTNNANDIYNGFKWRTSLVTQTSFTLKARLENGIVSVWFNDELLTACNDLYTVDEIVTQLKIGDYGSVNGSFNLFPYVKNTIAFSTNGTYYVSQLTYKEW